MAVSSRNLDLYEPFCAEAVDTAPVCNKLYSFEKIITSRMVNATTLQELRNQTVDGCLTACMSSSKKCGAVNYDVSSTNCYLMSASKTDKEATIVQDESFDYYEPACLLEAQETSTVTPAFNDIFLLHEKNRTLRQEFRNIQHWDTGDLVTCCASASDPELQQLAEFESIPRLTALSEHKYTGAVYAAERFEQCRVFVRSSNRFAIFIPRPQHNTWCNALEILKPGIL
ncbi:PAN domain protein [Teladorsagia circumcincta]|uniref:PAN domain protein n=1 Tax=Teladorsagia circumcincta TaxID=45464 RepID=A0A2G9U0T0_TELCI|nr:PAN domain protein [Teladorsagia circumcincta]